MFTEDLDQFLDTNDFGYTIIWGTKEFEGIFDNTTTEVDIDGQVVVEEQLPIILCKDEDIAGMQQGELITVKDTGTRYTVTAFAPDGTGMTQLALNLA